MAEESYAEATQSPETSIASTLRHRFDNPRRAAQLVHLHVLRQMARKNGPRNLYIENPYTVWESSESPANQHRKSTATPGRVALDESDMPLAHTGSAGCEREKFPDGTISKSHGSDGHRRTLISSEGEGGKRPVETARLVHLVSPS